MSDFISSEDNSPKRCVDYANELSELCGLQFPRISRIKDINSSFFVSLFKCITGYPIPDYLENDDSTTDTNLHNIQAVIDTLSLDLVGLSLSHITGEDIVSGNVTSIINLLEVLEALFVHLPSKVKKSEKELYDASTSEQRLKTSLVSEQINGTFTIENLRPENDDDSPTAKELKRKTCENTLKKSYHQVPKKTITVSSHSKSSDTHDNLKLPIKRKSTKPVVTTYKRPNIENIENLLESNFKKKIQSFLQSDKSPVIHAQELRKNYIQSLETPLQKKSIVYCKKSFLLPHDLRPKPKPPVRQHHARRKILSRIQEEKQQLHENIIRQPYDLRPKLKSSVRKNHALKKTSKIQERKQQLHENIKNGMQDEEIPAAIQFMLKEFPGFQFSENILEQLKRQHYHHANSMHKQLRNLLLKKPTVVKQTEKAIAEEAKLSKILTKDLQEKEYLRKINEHKALQIRIKASLRDAQMQSVKMKQYYEEFVKSMSRKMKKRNFSEDVLMERTFKEMLKLQKEKVHLLCKRVKEADEYDAVQHRKYLANLKNVYQQQLNLLTESVNAEQKESLMREKSKKQIIEKFNNEYRKKLEKEIQTLQKDVNEMLEDNHFQKLDAENFLINCQLEDF